MTFSRTAAANLDQTYWDDHQLDGITFIRWLHPNEYYGYGTGVDNAIFTGFYLASAAFRYSVTPNDTNLSKIERTLDGIHLLTHISGTPGVLVRVAFPLEDAYQKIGYVPESMQPEPQGWGPGNSWWDRKSEGSLYESDTHFYYCRTTRDQLTGIVLGLSVAWNVLNHHAALFPKTDARHDNCVSKIQIIVQDLVTRLEKTDWSLKDHTGLIGDTNAHRLKDNLQDALVLLNCTVNNKPRPSIKGLKRFYRFLWFYTFYYRFTRHMYAWNLRTAIAFSLWINETDSILRAGAKKWMKRISAFTKNEDNAFFVFAEAVMGNDVSKERLDAALEALDQLSEVGHNSFFAWQKSKDEARPAGMNGGYGPGIDVLLPYWMHQYYLEGRV